MHSTKEKLIVFTRYPVPGKVKTRLISVLGEKSAAALYELMVGSTVLKARCCAAARGAKIEMCFDGCSKSKMCHWLGNGLEYRHQHVGDLGRRMELAFHDAFQSGFGPVVLVGCDCPELTAEDLWESLEALKDHDMVIGPAIDGGYYLIGLRRHVPRLFMGVDWGSEVVLEQTLRIAASEGLKVARVRKLLDVDRPDDLALCRAFGMLEPPADTVSVVIAALNEENHIREAISAAAEGTCEVIVADGGSSDNTVQLARQAGALVLTVPYGRAAQFNTAALKSGGGVLLFLHADTVLPKAFAADVLQTTGKTDGSAGAFKLGYDSDSAGIRLTEVLVNLRSRFRQLPYGDQAIFMARDVFLRMGGFADMPIMEDYELIRRLRRRGRIVTQDKAVRTSARRWLQMGVFKTTMINQMMVFGYRLGISPERLAAFYRKNKGTAPANDARGKDQKHESPLLRA